MPNKTFMDKIRLFKRNEKIPKNFSDIHKILSKNSINF